MTLDLLLAQAAEILEAGQKLGSMGTAAVLGIVAVAEGFVIWKLMGRVSAAQDKLDAFQDARITELSEMLKALGGK